MYNISIMCYKRHAVDFFILKIVIIIIILCNLCFSDGESTEIEIRHCNFS